MASLVRVYSYRIPGVMCVWSVTSEKGIGNDTPLPFQRLMQIAFLFVALLLGIKIVLVCRRYFGSISSGRLALASFPGLIS